MKRKNLLLTLLFLLAVNFPLLAQTYPFQDESLSIDERVADLVSRLTLDEKLEQIHHNAPAIERLGIPCYNWWNECLHGVARSRDTVTVFPQAIGMAATFDVPAMIQTGEIISTEARALYNETNRITGGNLQYKGLTFWTPNINIFRDPRWGRGQETYGEDPYLTSEIGKAMVYGLQGSDPVMLKASACAKHFAVHSGPEPERHVFDAIIDDYDLWDTYLPAFRSLVVDAQVSSVMGAYNRFRGQPCNANDELMHKILRGYWNFKGYITTDCFAIRDFFRYHKTHKDSASSCADALKHTVDLECGEFGDFAKAFATKQITEKDLDSAMTRLFRIRFRLGMFDKSDRYASIPYSVLEAPAHKAHALLMAQESMVLLKNNGILPLKKNLKKVVVLGPNADNKGALLGNYNGFPSEIVTPLQAIKRKTSAEIVYLKANDYLKPIDNEENIRAVLKDADLVIYCGGITPDLEGEQGETGVDKLVGFRGGDRTSINLPAVQTSVMQLVKRQGLPLVFVSMSGSAIAFPWEAENADAIIQAWYGGQDAGTAVADVLWGDFNPSGRLPVTFYASDDQLPDFMDYTMKNRTYRYFTGKPMYEFGYGLSYTSFEYSKPRMVNAKAVTGEDLTFEVTVKNTGKRAGGEVSQLYLSYPDAPAPKPLKALKGFKRIYLLPGEEQVVRFTLNPRDLSLVGKDGVSRCAKGKINVFIGGGQPNEKNAKSQSILVPVTGKTIALPR